MTALRQPITRPLSLDEAVQLVYRDALAGRSVAEAAGEYAHQVDVSDINDALIIGVAELAHRRLARQRRGGAVEDGADAVDEIEPADGSDSPPAKAKPHYALEGWKAILAGNYEAADGSRKSLIDFNADDAIHLRNVAGNRADGYVRLRDSMDRAVSALHHHKADSIGKLPVKEQKAIAEGLV